MGFWSGVQRGCVYGMTVSVIGFTVAAALLSPWFLAPAVAGAFFLPLMAYTLGRDDQEAAEIRRRARQFWRHPDWPVCEAHDSEAIKRQAHERWVALQTAQRRN